MKKLMVAVMMLAMASVAVAGPLAQTAAPVEVGQIDGAALVTIGLGDAVSGDLGITARAIYGAIENLSAQLSLGYVSPDVGDSVENLTLAGQYALTLDLPVDLAVRAALDIGDLSNASDTMAITPGIVVSKSIEAVAGLALYLGLGYEIPVGNLADYADNELAIAFGATYDIAAVENLSAVAEISMIKNSDTMGLTLGASYAF